MGNEISLNYKEKALVNQLTVLWLSGITIITVTLGASRSPIHKHILALLFTKVFTEISWLIFHRRQTSFSSISMYKLWLSFNMVQGLFQGARRYFCPHPPLGIGFSYLYCGVAPLDIHLPPTPLNFYTRHLPPLEWNREINTGVNVSTCTNIFPFEYIITHTCKSILPAPRVCVRSHRSPWCCPRTLHWWRGRWSSRPLGPCCSSQSIHTTLHIMQCKWKHNNII